MFKGLMPYAKGEVMNITVYLGASKGNDNTLANAVRELGTWIGESGNSLVYGGSKSGLMGEDCRKCAACRGEGYRCGTTVFY